MSVTAKYEAILVVSDLMALALDKAPDVATDHKLSEVKGVLTATTTPPATKVFSDQRQLAAGTNTIDLETLLGALGSALTFTGLKVQLVMIVAAAANTDRILVEPAAVNPYNLFGAATAEVSLGPGEAVMFVAKDSLSDVGATASDITVTSPDTDAIYEILLVAG